MAGHRIERINADAQRELAGIIRTLKDPRIPMMTTVTGVRVTEDLKFAKVYISVLGDEETRAAAFSALKAAAGHIRGALASRLDLRITPQLLFERDDSMDQGARIDRLLKDIKSEDK